jgi:lysophospholipase L1-like esterase
VISYGALRMACSAPSMLVLGDSFVSRLRDLDGLKLQVRGVDVVLEGYPGGTVRDLLRILEEKMVVLYRDGIPFWANLVVLSVGGNDLCNINMTSERFIDELMDLSWTLLVKFGVSQVIVCQILHRAKHHHKFMRGMSLEDYNHKVDEVNRTLAVKLSSELSIRYWSHHHSCLGPNRLAPDGVHLNRRGLEGFRRSIHYALSSSSNTSKAKANNE